MSWISETEINTDPAEDDGGGIGSLSLTEDYPSDYKCGPDSVDSDGFDWSLLRDWDESEVAPVTPPSSVEDYPLNLGTNIGPCLICGRAHSDDYCEYRFYCPIDQKIGEGFVIVCPCLADVENGKCPRSCSYRLGRVTRKGTLADPSVFFSIDTVQNPDLPRPNPCEFEPYEEREGDNIII